MPAAPRRLVLAVALLATIAVAVPAIAQRAAVAFDSSRAYEHVRQLVALGPRPAGSAGAAAARRYVSRELAALGLTTAEQTFAAQTPVGAVEMTNVTARIAGQRPERLLIASHYDTKRFTEFPFVGANDGGSSTALVLELARVLKARRNRLTIELVFFDGEEAIIEWTDGDHTYGSRHYVQAARRDGSIRTVAGLILFDMVGDRDLNIRRETYSTPWLTDILWSTAQTMKQPAFVDEEFAVNDDHQPFLDAGIPAVDIVDLDYAPWHTKDDTLDKVSARSLQIVADVFLAALPELEKRLLKSTGKR